MRKTLLGAALAALAVTGAGAQEPAARPPMPSKDPTEFTGGPAKPSSVRGDFTLIAIGDMLYSHPYADTTDPDLRKVLDIVKSGDVTVTNQEGVFIDLKTFRHPAYGNGQLWGDGVLAKDMKAMGIDTFRSPTTIRPTSAGRDWSNRCVCWTRPGSSIRAAA